MLVLLWGYGMNEAKLLAELMLQLSIYFESDTDDIAEWLTTENTGLHNRTPMFFILLNDIELVHKFVMKDMA